MNTLVGLVVIATIVAVCSAQTVDVIQTTYGPIQGAIRDDNKVWLGVPFAAPPVGDLRFQHPVAPTPWTETKQTTEFSLACPQGNAQTPLPPAWGEDCLYLNVFAPLNTNTSNGGAGKGLPVYVYVFGGAWTVGYTQKYDGAFLAGQDIIVVTMNYRLGLLGYMAHPVLLTGSTVNTTGMYAIQDQRMALQWVKDNIANFGGDTNRITLGGQSAGGNAVVAHLVAPRSAGLFNQMIISSGLYSFNEVASGYSSGASAITRLGCNKTTDAETLACLRGLPVGVIVNNTGSIRPTISEWEFTGQPSARVTAGNFNNVPLFVGTNLNESSSQGSWCSATPYMTAQEFYNYINSSYGARWQEALEYYPLSNYPTPISDRIAIASDSTFICPAKGFFDIYAQVNPNVYVYRYDHYPVYDAIPTSVQECLGAGHGFEMYNIWPSYFTLWTYGQGNYTAEELQLQTNMRNAWVAFISNGKPVTPSGLEWPKYTFAQGEFMSLETGNWANHSFFASATCPFFGIPNSPNYPPSSQTTTTTDSNGVR